MQSMAYKHVVFADRLVGMTVQDGLVRMDLAVNAGTVKGSDDSTKQRMEVTTQLEMPLVAFDNAVAMQQKALLQLGEQGKKRRAAKIDDAPPSTRVRATSSPRCAPLVWRWQATERLPC